jgi:hypothetical protein
MFVLTLRVRQPNKCPLSGTLHILAMLLNHSSFQVCLARQRQTSGLSTAHFGLPLWILSVWPVDGRRLARRRQTSGPSTANCLVVGPVDGKLSGCLVVGPVNGKLSGCLVVGPVDGKLSGCLACRRQTSGLSTANCLVVGPDEGRQ